MSKDINFTLECAVSFLGEKRTKLYKWYCAGVSQAKTALRAKNVFANQICFGLERQGV